MVEPGNLLFIMSDEHNPAFAGHAGHPVVKTPHLDALAARGTRFESAYCNSPICVPSRASFATGRYVHDCGFWDNADPYDGSVPSWGHRLIEQGHQVVSIGKLHYRDSRDPNGFVEEINPLHVVDGVGDLIGLIRDEMPERGAARRYANDTGPGESTYTAYDRDIAAAAVRWLHEEAPKFRDKPWLLFVSFVCPHFPLIAPPAFYELYDEAAAWPELYGAADRPQHPYYQAMRRCMNYDAYFDEAKVRRAVTGYLGLCSFLDDNIGTLLKALSDAGLAESCRVIYTSDHGEALGKRGLWGKSTMFEEAVGVPLLMAGPGVPAGRSVRTPVSLVDCHPTIVEAVGAAPHPGDADLPGRSLFGLCTAADVSRSVFAEYHAAASPTGAFMVRDARYKLVYFVGMAAELFDLEDDPDETRNLADDPDHAAVMAELTAQLHWICDPLEVDRRAKADQQAKIAAHGGRDEILGRGDFGYSPAPGQTPEFA